MDPGLLYLIGTAATWFGWFGLLRAAFLLISLIGKAPEFRVPIFRSAGSSAALAAVGFLVGATLLPKPEELGWRFPIVWLVMPTFGWAAAIGFGFAATRFVQAFLAVNTKETRDRLTAGLIWLGFFAIALAAHLATGDEVTILRGGIRMSSQTALGLVLLILATFAVIVLSAQSFRARGFAKALGNYLALGAGAVIFGLPFAWLLITSFKEDQDMSSPNGLVWIPHVQKTVPYTDPDDPLVEGKLEGQTVRGRILEKHADGSATIDIYSPAVLRGLTFEAPAPLNIVPEQKPVVTGNLDGQDVVGKVVKDLEDGRRRIEVMEPASLSGKRFEAKPEEVTPVRPVGLKVSNYPEALDFLPPETKRGLLYLQNSLIIVILNVIGTVLSSSIAAYAFARLRFPGKGMIFLILLSTMMLPAAVTLVPTFLIFRWLGWIDTLQPLWVTAFFGSAFNIFLLRQFFMSIPMELEDASKIDGCGYMRTFWQVMLPQVKPALAVIAIWTFMGSWNNFLGPLIYINSPEKMPVSYAVQLFQGDRLNEPGLLMAFTTMAMIPVLLVFFFAQKYFIEGVTLSGLGGR